MSLLGPCFISAGEHSGDLLAADLVLELKNLAPRLECFGVTGEAMQQAGVESLATTDELGVMGFWEVAGRLARLRVLEREILAEIDRRSPCGAILVDFPGFHFRLAEQLKLRGIPVVQYVAPKVWAWGAGRLARLKRDFTQVLGVFPFEGAYFEKHGVPFRYVGSPHRHRTDKIKVSRAELGLPLDKPLIAFLPGSRLSELRRILPLLLGLEALLRSRIPKLQFVVPLASNMPPAEVESCLRGLGLADGVKDNLHFVEGMSLEIMAVADAACVASGTATLECALLGTPLAVVYRMNELSYQIAARRVKMPWVSLVNILAERRVVAEFIQDFSLEALASELGQLVVDSPRRRAMQAELQSLRASLEGPAADEAARQVVAAFAEARPHAGR